MCLELLVLRKLLPPRYFTRVRLTHVTSRLPPDLATDRSFMARNSCPAVEVQLRRSLCVCVCGEREREREREREYTTNGSSSPGKEDEA